MSANLHALRHYGAILAFGVLLPAAAIPLRAQSPAPSSSNVRRATSYRITTNDRLAIHIFQEDDLSLPARVDGNGNVSLNLVGLVHLSGDTLPEAEQAIEKAYREHKILQHPEVKITVEEPAPRQVNVQGQIKNPNRYNLEIDAATTLSEIISRAGGFTDTAKGTAVRVTRTSSDGTIHVIEVDVDDVMKGKEKHRDKVDAANMPLEPGDNIYVPERII